jgi:hypothetical protein
MKQQDCGDLGEAVIDAPGKLSVKASKSEAPKGALSPVPIRQSTSSSPPARARACCPASSRQEAY